MTFEQYRFKGQSPCPHTEGTSIFACPECDQELFDEVVEQERERVFVEAFNVAKYWWGESGLEKEGEFPEKETLLESFQRWIGEYH